jgi:hypothetical protein
MIWDDSKHDEELEGDIKLAEKIQSTENQVQNRIILN